MGKTSAERSQEFRKRLKLNKEKHKINKAKEHFRWKQRSEIAREKDKSEEGIPLKREKGKIEKSKMEKTEVTTS